MRIYVDIDSKEFLASPSYPRPITLLEFKRRDQTSVELYFLRDKIALALETGATVRLGLKSLDAYTSDFLTFATLSQTGSGSSAIYIGNLNLNTTSIEAAFASETSTISAMIEVEWQSGSSVDSSVTLPVTIHNDVIRGDEGDPATLPLFYTSTTSDFLATQSEAEAGTDNTKWMSPLRTAEAIAALASGGSSYLPDPPISGTYVLGSVNGTVQWISTEEC